MAKSQPVNGEFETNWAMLATVGGLIGAAVAISLAGASWTPTAPEKPELPPVLAELAETDPAPPVLAHSSPLTSPTTENQQPQVELTADPINPTEVQPTDPKAPALHTSPLEKKQAKFVTEYDRETSYTARDTVREYHLHDRSRLDFEGLVREATRLRKDKDGLPFLDGDECRKDGKSVAWMREIVSELGLILNSGRQTRPPASGSQSKMFVAQAKALELLKNKDRWERPEAIPTLVQILQVQLKPLRKELIEILGRIKGAEATRALADRAMFDPDPDLRRHARLALRKRNLSQTRPRLHEGLRHVWEPAAAFAAQALIEVDGQDSVPHLVELLDAPDPDEPFRNERYELLQREIVRLNHMKNCVTCHKPERFPDSRNPLRGFVPLQGEAPPVVYYSSRSGSFVDARTTYLRQEFSLVHDIENAAPWPGQQRFDYVVRLRRVSSQEEVEFEERRRTRLANPPYRQREAVLFALRGLTGIDAGDSSEDWRRELGLTEAGTSN